MAPGTDNQITPQTTLQTALSFSGGPLTLAGFIAKWQQSTQSEKASAQSHFRDLCTLLGQPDPSADPHGADYAFEKSVSKIGGGQGFADVWRRHHFAWEYKGKHKNLGDAYKQLLGYREDLGNPPLLVVCDLARFEVHTNFTDTAKKVYAFTLADLLSDDPTPTCSRPPLGVLRALFEQPESLRPERTTVQVTEEAAAQFSRLADSLRGRGNAPQATAQFLIRLLFCLFAEDVGLLPGRLMTRLVETTRFKPETFGRRLSLLFGAMAHGGDFGEHDIKHFNGGLFQNADVLELTQADLAVLLDAAKLDWDSIEPSVFGTLFERGLDPAQRSQLGAHYTSRADILLIVEPVLMAPLRRRWRDVQAEVLALLPQKEGANTRQQSQISAALLKRLQDFAAEIASVQVLDPACGSGNFLYVALRELLDLEKEVINFAATCDLSGFFSSVGPEQMHGIELNEFAAQLAPITVNIGFIQWKRDNAFGQIEEPILKHTKTIWNQDALVCRQDGLLAEPPWPNTDVIIGNPPFLGGNRIRQELGDDYVEALFKLYEGRVPAFSDLVCYWFERARGAVASDKAKRAGLIATNSIRNGASRKVLERIKETGEIFLAWSDRPWVLNGASVRVSMVGFDNGLEEDRQLDGLPTSTIHADLTKALNITVAQRLKENTGICFMGPSAKAPLEITASQATEILNDPVNINGRPNSDVVRPVVNALDLVKKSRQMWTIDFGVMPLAIASEYEAPFEYVKKHVYPIRSTNRRKAYAEKWWQYAEARPGMRKALQGAAKYIATPAVAKHRIFVWVEAQILSNQRNLVFAREDDYFFGVLHSRVHELWTLKMCSYLGVGNDPCYTPTSTFETFPFPWPPGHEPAEDPQVQAISAAARALVEKRGIWLNPDGAAAADLAKRTLTNLYNACPAWLSGLHGTLDAAVLAAYGWPADMGDADLLERLLALNAERAG